MASPPRDVLTPARQRPEEILAQTLSAPPHPEATDGWSARGRRIFLVAMAAAGVLLVVAGLLVSKQLAPGPGNPAPLETGPGNGLADQLLQTSAGDQGGGPPTSASIAIPIPATPTTRPARTSSPSQNSVSPASPTVPANTAGPQSGPSGGTTPSPSPTTTIPCAGLLGQSLQQIQLPCRANTRSTSTSPLG